MYVYIRSEPGLWTVGFFKPDGTWEAESDHADKQQAAERVHWLNGGRIANMADRYPPAADIARRSPHPQLRGNSEGI